MSVVFEVAPRTSTVRVLSVVVGVSVAVSALGGMLWGFLAPAQQLLVVAQDRGAALTGESLHRFDGLALFSFVSLALGLVIPIGWWLWKSERGPRLFGAILVGALAGSVAALLVGNGIAALRFPKAADPAVGSIVTVAPSIDTPLVLIVQALMASLVILLLAAMNPNDNLHYTDPEPDVLDVELSPPPPSFDSNRVD
ncbi:hypothetical protein CH306_20310 [Rhodococcus sp. 15-725-2-2b]|uniref:DUF2567 domain-containing protein n=1 Tax=unclassified Rhodococcus (in: high G+C Gram-positive bacteria) TaxID=192944 RepID=UPI000B9AC473|nr:MULTISPECIES: DUF2567 domain-containing protein [unclassified Rhodococcus (in: high G+C Gram-positive bacteria)]OZC65113.1 hypothetical protein CH277_20215 [Rhodococcus sp. 06-469-3-2]OZD46728.1 hypothetical protein CH264_09530 [Rhodococcus sp. 06-1477-1A]OZE71524.1 hypothetical protein CH306_20310 [Rhodococcus sp. 15-725-2-2b]